jgi:uridine phosphorylase
VKSKTSWYLKLSAEDCAPRVILVGDPARQALFAEQMANVREVANEREFRTITGEYKGQSVSVITVGIGAPAAVLVLEELWELGVQVVVRAGTGMSLGIPLGNFVLVQAAARHEGVSAAYLPLNFPAVPDMDLFHSFFHTLKEEKAPLSAGVILTSDSFYTDLLSHSLPDRQPPRSQQTLLQQYAAVGVISADMETSALYVAAKYLGLRCVTLLVATVDGAQSRMLDDGERQSKERELARLALEGITRYAEKH